MYKEAQTNYFGRDSLAYNVTPTLGADDIWTDYKQYKICIPKALSSKSEMLLGNQQAVIKADGIFPVNVGTRVYISGWLEREPRMACILVNFPRLSKNDRAGFNHVPLSYVFEKQRCLGGVVLADLGVCETIAVGEYNIAFQGLDAIYEPILKR
jgi:hypothetical protein